ncbi:MULTISPECIES: hypothetical protein [Klebsiella]|uniref:hypothetical protein n=1 Tax=Klebsiella TaxID=570 RepID=UPI00115B40DF|nr:hypothetical protein [Klebsiella oxytoca]MBZ7725626.1 hypothetical protein [Klebsiella oxytoca]UWC76403.1 hypothetical protein M5T43_20340 [Klebsiella oxytoca]HBM3275559.1 hypothetical protein [Klebsiella oxytoca]HCQ8390840.1 hypothetical protein [Klebsiella oxytoca]HCQ8704986.1 hypothetical protein [Klebsiella oxytoca]
MKIIDFEPEHILQIKPQDRQSYIQLTIEYGQLLADGNCFTGVHEGKVVAIGGIIPVCPGRGFLHLIVSEGIPHQWIKLFRAARRLIDAVQDDYIRLETLSGFEEADRWLELLGFEFEGVLRKVMPDGSDAKSYSIVRS